MCSCSSVVEHCVSSAKGHGFNSQGTHMKHTDKKCIAWIHCKSLWIKASAKCINVKWTDTLCKKMTHLITLSCPCRPGQASQMIAFSNKTNLLSLYMLVSSFTRMQLLQKWWMSPNIIVLPAIISLCDITTTAHSQLQTYIIKKSLFSAWWGVHLFSG